MKAKHLINYLINIGEGSAIPAFPLHLLSIEDEDLYILKKKGPIVYNPNGYFKATVQLIGCGLDKVIIIEGILESPFWTAKVEKTES